MYIQPFSMEVDWPEIECLMEVSIMLDIWTYCIFILWGRFRSDHFQCVKKQTNTNQKKTKKTLHIEQSLIMHAGLVNFCVWFIFLMIFSMTSLVCSKIVMQYHSRQPNLRWRVNRSIKKMYFIILYILYTYLFFLSKCRKWNFYLFIWWYFLDWKWFMLLS